MRTILTALCIIAAAAAHGDTKITLLADVTADRAETVTGPQSNDIAAAAAHIPRTDNPHGVTAAQVGAITAEQDLAALRAYHYGSPDIVESPAEWFVFDGAGTITAFNWAAGRENVVIPWAIGGVPVTAIGANAFGGVGSIVSVIAPQTVTMIGSGAFVERYFLTSVSFPQAQTIGGSVFYNCGSLTSVSLPKAQTIGGNAFAYCDSLASVSLPQATSIGADAFAYCGSLASVSLPQAQTIGGSAFAYCDSLASVSLPQAQTIGDSVFAYCDSLASVSLPQAQTIGDSVFYNCPALASVLLPQAQTIGGSAFYYCNSLASVSLPQAQTIGGSAFADCYSLASVLLPQATSIGADAFAYCSSLTSVRMGRNAPAEAADVFSNITPPPTVYVTNPQATGWGDTWNGAPVVRPNLYADNLYQGGERAATENYVDNSILNMSAPMLIIDGVTYRQYWDTNLLTTAWEPVQ